MNKLFTFKLGQIPHENQFQDTNKNSGVLQTILAVLLIKHQYNGTCHVIMQIISLVLTTTNCFIFCENASQKIKHYILIIEKI